MTFLKEKRLAAGFTQEQAADTCGVKRSTYAMHESGARTPKPKTVKEYAAHMNFDWTEFYEDPEPESGEA